MDKAIRSVLQKYATFNGRASRSEYWYWILAFWIGWYIIIAFTHLYPIYEFGLFVPTLAVGVRRLHDSNHVGWWLLVPLVNLFLLVSPSVEPNRFGGDSAGAMSSFASDPGTSRSDQGVLDAALTTHTCSSCGTVGQVGQNFCRSCGTKFE